MPVLFPVGQNHSEPQFPHLKHGEGRCQLHMAAGSLTETMHIMLSTVPGRQQILEKCQLPAICCEGAQSGKGTMLVSTKVRGPDS